MEKMTQEQIEMKRLELMERQIALQEKQAAALETQVERTAPKENPDYIPKSVFHDPQGKPWSAALKCEMLQGPFKLNDQNLTEAEVRELNRMQPIDRAHLLRADRAPVEASVAGTYGARGDLVKLVITYPMGRDHNSQVYTPLDDIAKQLADQALAVIA